jgi:transposase-like protein
VQANVASGATLITDSHKGYLGLDDKGYTHRRINIKRSGQTGSDLLPGVHLVASLLDRVWLGTHHGALRWRHLDAYLDEFVFRFNRRGSRARGLLFYRLMEGAVATDHAPLRDIWGGTP